MKENELTLEMRKITTKTKNEIFKEQLEFGEEGEKIVEEYLTQKENRICMCMRQFNPTTAPILKTNTGYLTSPDIISFRANKAIFVECKRKYQWVTGFNMNSKRETGLDMKHWLHYTQLVRNTYTPLEIYFIHEKETPLGIYRININLDILYQFTINPNLFRIDTMYKGGKPVRMIFFPFEMLERVVI